MNDVIGSMLREWRIKIVLPFIQGDVLDVGCGNNELCIRYRKSHPGAFAVGVDVHPWEGVDTIIDNTAALPFPDRRFDTVCCIAALNHIPEREGFLKESARLLRPGGRFVMTMLPQGISRIWHCLRSPWDADQHERGMKDGETYGFGVGQIEEMLKRNEFHIVRTQRFMLGINVLFVAEHASRST